jgi:hypothetical protein
MLAKSEQRVKNTAVGNAMDYSLLESVDFRSAGSLLKREEDILLGDDRRRGQCLAKNDKHIRR